MGIKSPEAELLLKFGEIFAAGLFEDRNASQYVRFARAIKRHLEHAEPECTDTRLYPARDKNPWSLISEQKISCNYSYSLGGGGLEEYLPQCDDSEKKILEDIIKELKTIRDIPIPTEFRIGGSGYTHSIINYERVLKEGLNNYKKRIGRKLNSAVPEKQDYYHALNEVLNAIILFHGKVLEKTGIKGFEQVPLKPARSFYEAMLCFNFMWYIDGCDSIGRFDQYMGKYLDDDLKKGVITIAEAETLLEELWSNFDACSGWHMILGGCDKHGNDSYNELTYLCLKTLKKFRRPNAGIRVTPAMPERLWKQIFENWSDGGVNPSLYNGKGYSRNITKYTGVKGDDLYEFAFGGCTELMFGGMSNVGSIDAGVNLLAVLENTIKKQLLKCKSFDDFLKILKRETAAQIKACIEASNKNQAYMAKYRPQLIRSLFTEDCIDSGKEFNAGGARYNGSVINFAGMTNVFNSLFTISKLFSGELKLDKEQFIKMLEADYAGYEKELKQINAFCKFGNDQHEIDSMAVDLSSFIFDEVHKYKCWRGDGFCIPGVILFVTYTALGQGIGATPDGRRAGEALADSVGAMQGTDRKGPTALLKSCLAIPQAKGIGTLVLNLRLEQSMLKQQNSLEKLKALILTYFEHGGLQIQTTIADQEALKKAVLEPDKYPNLMIRIGGYSEYFNRLSDELKKEVIKRTILEI